MDDDTVDNYVKKLQFETSDGTKTKDRHELTGHTSATTKLFETIIFS